MSFTSVIEDIQQLPLEDKIKVRSLLDKYVSEEKRDRLYKKYRTSLNNAKAGKLNFSSDIDELLLIPKLRFGNVNVFSSHSQTPIWECKCLFFSFPNSDLGM